MAEAVFPARTAGEITLSDGTTVWVKTLNMLQREEVESEANWYAQSRCRRFRKGADRHEDLRAEFAELGAGPQAEYLASHELIMGQFQTEAEEKHPEPPKPERGDLTEEQFMTACEKWEQDCKKAAEKRKKYEESRYETERKAAEALSPKVRLERCLISALQRRFMEFYLTRLTLETLYRAVRQGEDHSQQYYATVQAVEDADDEERDQLVKFYRELDRVPAKDLPTSPKSC